MVHIQWNNNYLKLRRIAIAKYGTVAFIYSIMLLVVACAGASGFEQCPNVCICKWKSGKQSVECTGKSLMMIPENLSPLTQLLDMSGNNLQLLPNETFVRVALLNLQKIYLQNCRIVQIDDRALLGLSNVVDLDLSINLLTHVPSSIFADIPNLRDLSLAQNPIQKIDNYAFQFVPALIRLDLSHCQLQMIASNAFHGIDSLESLKINGNRLKELKPKTVEALTALHGVELHDNLWYCDCSLRHVKIWLTSRNIPHPVQPVCYGGSPHRVPNVPFKDLHDDDFACKPEIRVKLDNQFVDGIVGENVTITCQVESIPTARITWYWNGRLLTNNSAVTTYHHRIIISETAAGEWLKNSSLIIMNAQETDSSQFYCVAENAAGNAEANFTLRVSNRIYGLAMLTSGQMAGLSLGLVLLIVCISFVIIYLLFRIRNSAPSSLHSKQVIQPLSPIRPLPNSLLASSYTPSKRSSSISPVSAHALAYHYERAQLQHLPVSSHGQSNPMEIAYSAVSLSSHCRPDRSYNNNYHENDLSDPDLIAAASSGVDLDCRFNTMNERRSIYPARLSNEHHHYSDKSSDEFYNIDSNDKTPIIEASSFDDQLHIDQIFSSLPYRHHHTTTTTTSNNNNVIFDDANNYYHHPDDYYNHYTNTLPSSAKTIRVWQKGVPVLPPMTDVLKRALSRNSPDEGYQEDCATDV